jgi:FAD binding domain
MMGSWRLLFPVLMFALLLQQPGESSSLVVAVDPLEGKNDECTDAQKLVGEVVWPVTQDMAKDAVQRAIDNDLDICVKSGGHSYTCNSAKPDCFQIDMSKMNSIELSEEEDGGTTRYFATIGPGVLTRDILKRFPEKEWAYVHGECFSVGAGGYFLHGGIHFGYGSALYGWGGQNVEELEVVTATGSVATVETIKKSESPDLIKHFTRAGSSFGLVTKIKVEIYRRKAPTAWLIPILSMKWTVAEAEEIYQKIWDVKESEPDFQIGFNVQTNNLLPPSLQIAYLPEDEDVKDNGWQKCLDLINDKLGLEVTPTAKLVARVMNLGFQTPIWLRYGIGLIYHLHLPPDALIPYYKPKTFIGSQFVREGPSFELVKEYFKVVNQNKNARCLFVTIPFFIPDTPYTDSGYFTLCGIECMGEDKTIAQDLQRRLMEEDPGEYWVYYNGPNVEENKCRYWPDYTDLAAVKLAYDPLDRFNVFQGIDVNGDCDGFVP